MNNKLNQFSTESEAINALKERGFTANFTPEDETICDPETSQEWKPDQITVKEYHRFEGVSNPGDMSIVYAIETDDGHRGILVDGYGTYSRPVLRELVKKARMEDGLR